MAAVFSFSMGGAEKVAMMTPVQKLATLRDIKKDVQVAYRGVAMKPAKTGTFPRDPNDVKHIARVRMRMYLRVSRLWHRRSLPLK